MKESPQGPFSRVRWFCKDGTILAPKPYACLDHGGGSQHGEWNARTRQLRSRGYKIANILADLDPKTWKDERGTFNQILLEQFLIAVDDGWILRKARFYRGALQTEDEASGARRILLSLAAEPEWVTRGFMPLRIGARLLPQGQETSSVAKVRQRSAVLADKDKGFMSLRNKIHGKPDAEDAARVREYAETVNDPELAAEYERLASNIDKIYASESLVQMVRDLSRKPAGTATLAKALRKGMVSLALIEDPARRLATTSKLMAVIREEFPWIRKSEVRLEALDTSLALEAENIAAATALRKQLPNATRRARLVWLSDTADAIYGAGLISERELNALRESFARLKGNEVSSGTYKTELDYLALVPGWGNNWLHYHFYSSMHTMTPIEPLAALFIQDLLRGSPLFFYAEVVDSLLRDANRLAGVRHQLFGKDVGAGLRGLNPGLARGTLRLARSENAENLASDGIYLLPQTVADLPPVAGILTAGEGNPLSHVQLLARNLGIPNVAVDEALIPELKRHEGSRIILAVSPRGSVQLAEYRGQLDAVFQGENAAAETLIRPDLQKLELETRDFVPLSQLRASDSGRTVGPKAAKLGELYHHYPEAVANGLAIPFGVFRELLDKPMEAEGKPVFRWMVDQYTALDAMAPGSAAHQRATEEFRKRLEQWILSADPGDEFRHRLRSTMEQVFGKEATYGVFVRSDTNVEDLPGFTGAGLNLTVPNVVGFDNILKAVSRVWASPFSRRAFAWRQSRMDQPQHVYPAVLLMRSVPSEKSGVMVTRDIETGEAGWLSVAVNRGVGGAVEGQAAESLRINTRNAQIRLLSQATAPQQEVLNAQGGVDKIPVSEAQSVLDKREIDQLIALARELPTRFPAITDAAGDPAAADIEFGFVNGRLKLFQIRPFLESAHARGSDSLNNLDPGISDRLSVPVAMDAIPEETPL
jgi:hypothetical protein